MHSGALIRVNYNVKGLKELDDLLKQLPARTASRVSTNALRAGARLIRDEARQQVPVETGDLKKSIKVLTGRTSKRDSRIVYVGVFGKDSPLAHIVEFGTAAHRIATKTKRVLADAAFGLFFGKVINHPGSREHPFLRPAADAKSIQALEVIGKVIGEGVEKEALKLGKRR